jgi:plastocyanin
MKDMPSMQHDRSTPSVVQIVMLALAAATIPVLLVIGYFGDSNRDHPQNLDAQRQSVIAGLPAVLTAAALATPAPTTAAQATPAAAVAGAQPLKETTTDNKYSTTKFTAKANAPITVTVTNNGQALHNFHITDATDANGQPIKTDLTAAGASSTVTFTIAKPGTYNFQCDVHPTEMMGTLTLS